MAPEYLYWLGVASSRISAKRVWLSIIWVYSHKASCVWVNRYIPVGPKPKPP
ncbi:hypothetical protein ACTXT7_008214 [Hymenolepis weldensis]